MIPAATVRRAWVLSTAALAFGLVWRAMAILGDGFWCLAAGDYVLRTWTLPAVDPFAFTSRHIAWMLHMPAFQVGGAWLVAHAGLGAFMVACTLPIAVAAMVLWLAPEGGLWTRLSTFPLVLLYLTVDAQDISARGQAFADLGTALLIVFLARLRGGRRVPLWSALLLGAAWANFHPSFLLAVVLPLAAAAAERLEPAGLRASTRPLLAFAGVALAGACINPWSFLLVVDVAKLAFDPTTAKIDLFQPPDFHALPWLLAPLVAMALLIRLARQATTGRGRSDAVLLIVLVAAACTARRHVMLLVAFEISLVAQLVSVLETQHARGGAPPRWCLRLLAFASGLELVLAVLLLSEHKDSLRDVPAEATAAVDRLSLPDRVLNPYHWGGYLEWAWRGERKVFIDGRNQLFSNGVFDDAASLAGVAPQSRTLLDVYEIRTVLWESGAPLDGALAHDPGWREVHRDRLAVVYARRDTLRDPTLER